MHYVKINLHGHLCTVVCNTEQQVMEVKAEMVDLGCDAESVTEPQGEELSFSDFCPA